MPQYIPILYPTKDRHLLNNVLAIGRTFSTIDEASLAIHQDWKYDIEDGHTIGLYVLEVKVDNRNVATVLDVHEGSKFMEHDTLEGLLVGLDSYISTPNPTNKATVDAFSDAMDAITLIAEEDGRYTDFLEEMQAHLESARPDIRETKRLIFQATRESATWTLGRVENPASAIAAQIDDKLVQWGSKILNNKPKAFKTEDALAGIIAASGLNRKAVMAIVRQATDPPPPKPEPTPEEVLEKKQKKVESELRKLEPYLEGMSSESRAFVEAQIHKNVMEDLPCIPMPGDAPASVVEDVEEAIEEVEEAPTPEPEPTPEPKPTPKPKPTPTATGEPTPSQYEGLKRLSRGDYPGGRMVGSLRKLGLVEPDSRALTAAGLALLGEGPPPPAPAPEGTGVVCDGKELSESQVSVLKALHTDPGSKVPGKTLGALRKLGLVEKDTRYVTRKGAELIGREPYVDRPEPPEHKPTPRKTGAGPRKVKEYVTHVAAETAEEAFADKLEEAGVPVKKAEEVAEKVVAVMEKEKVPEKVIEQVAAAPAMDAGTMAAMLAMLEESAKRDREALLAELKGA